MSLLGVDIGTTHCKAGLFSERGEVLEIASRVTLVKQTPDGHSLIDPEALLEQVLSATSAVLSGEDPARVSALGITGMAETGLFVDRRSGAPRTPFIPWFDKHAAAQAERFVSRSNPEELLERFSRSGIRPSYKCSLFKILWIQDQEARLLDDATWLSVEDYIAYRLTGVMATDASLAGRTFAFRIDKNEWDDSWLSNFGLSAQHFPRIVQNGSTVGTINTREFADWGLPEGIPVSIAGHDHLCAAFAVGAVKPGRVFDSMGTAESLVGGLEEQPLGEAEYRSGLGFGRHVVPGYMYWLGGLSASGGSIEWMRGLLGEPPVSYQEIERMLEAAGPQPGEILFFPHLAGRGAPHTGPSARAAFVGLTSTHARADLVKAVLEGTAYEMEAVRRRAEQALGNEIRLVVAAGGGTRNRRWMQIKADISECRFEIHPVADAACLGAALLAGVGCGVFSSFEEVWKKSVHSNLVFFLPNQERSRVYRRIFEQGYLPLQEPLNRYYGLG